MSHVLIALHQILVGHGESPFWQRYCVTRNILFGFTILIKSRLIALGASNSVGHTVLVLEKNHFLELVTFYEREDILLHHILRSYHHESSVMMM